MNTTTPNRTTYLTLHSQPNRRAEFWSDSDEGPVLVFSYRDDQPNQQAIEILSRMWLTMPDFCVHICSSNELDQPTNPLP